MDDGAGLWTLRRERKRQPHQPRGATGKLLHLRFAGSENTFDYFHATRGTRTAVKGKKCTAWYNRLAPCLPNHGKCNRCQPRDKNSFR